jgi:hypothetical protein
MAVLSETALSLEGEVQRLTDMLIGSQMQEQLLNQSLLKQTRLQDKLTEKMREAKQRCEYAEQELDRYRQDNKKREDDLVAIIEEVDSEKCRVMQECDELRELLSSERERSAKAAVDHDSHAAASQRRCEELEQGLQVARDERGSASSELASAQANNVILTAQLDEISALHRQRFDALAASLSAAEQGQNAVQLQLEEAALEVARVKAQLQGSVEREAATCDRVSALEAQLAACDAAGRAELDRVCRSHVQECDELRELLSSECERCFGLQSLMRLSVFQSDVNLHIPASSTHKIALASVEFSPKCGHLTSSFVVEADSQTDFEFTKFEADFQRYQMQVYVCFL